MRRLPPSQQESLRKRVMAVVRDGMSTAEAVRVFGGSRRSVRNWKARFDTDGTAGLDSGTPGRRAGEQTKLSGSEAEALVGSIVDYAPGDRELGGKLWTRRKVCVLARRLFGCPSPIIFGLIRAAEEIVDERPGRFREVRDALGDAVVSSDSILRWRYCMLATAASGRAALMCAATRQDAIPAVQLPSLEWRCPIASSAVRSGSWRRIVLQQSGQMPIGNRPSSPRRRRCRRSRSSRGTSSWPHMAAIRPSPFTMPPPRPRRRTGSGRARVYR